MIVFIIHYYNMSHTAKTTISAPIDSNNRDYDTCDECNVFREKKWKLCAKCGNHIEYFEDTRSKLNMKLNDVLPVNENVLFFNTLIIDVSEHKLGHPLDKVININDMANIGKITIHPQHNGFSFTHGANTYLLNKYLLNFMKLIEIPSLIINPRYESRENSDKQLITELLANPSHTQQTYQYLMEHNPIENIRTYSQGYIIKRLIKFRISEPLCINFADTSDMFRIQKIDDKTCKLIIKELSNTAIPNWKYYTRDNFKFLDDIKCTLYYSPKFDLLYTFDELKKYFDVEFKVYNIKINEYSEPFRLRNIRVRILNEKFERLFHFADIRNNITKHLPTDFAVKEEHEKHHMMVLMYLLGLEKC